MRNSVQRVVLALLVLGLLLGGTMPAQVVGAEQRANVTARYFKETGHNIAGAIKDFYEARGDVGVFGLPLTEVIVEGGLQVQYFERARFELRPELASEFYVSLTPLGRIVAQGRTDAAFRRAAPRGGESSAYFKETGHNLSDAFLSVWQARGGLRVFGYPISEAFQEASPTDGVVREVQYFERARFEYHPDAPRGSRVQLGLLGKQVLDRSGVAQAARQPAGKVVLLGTATTNYYGSVVERVNNIKRSADRMNGLVVQPGQTFSFNAALGSVGADDGYVDGYAIVNGRLEKVVGGGICQVSTTMYRAVFNAGLKLVSRRNHSYVINFYENVLGWDATVFAPYTDFKWQNDTKGPVYITTATNTNKASVTFSIWGYSDGRTSTMVGPTVTNRKAAGAPVWQYDPSLKRGQVKQLVYGRPGMDVAMKRIVRTADGRILHNDDLQSKYKPWEDFFLYGPGVTPPKGVTIIPATTKPSAPSRP